MFMSTRIKRIEPYQGFEQGPIRPPSEAYSLLIRVTLPPEWHHALAVGPKF